MAALTYLRQIIKLGVRSQYLFFSLNLQMKAYNLFVQHPIIQPYILLLKRYILIKYSISDSFSYITDSFSYPNHYQYSIVSKSSLSNNRLISILKTSLMFIPMSILKTSLMSIPTRWCVMMLQQLLNFHYQMLLNKVILLTYLYVHLKVKRSDIVILTLFH